MRFSQTICPVFIIALFLFYNSTCAFAESHSFKQSNSSDGRYIDHKNGAITDKKTGLMWAKNDSYAATGKCVSWNDSKNYVSGLNYGGYTDWRLPSVIELKSLYEKSKPNNISYSHNSAFPLYLDSIFGDVAAYGYWSSEEAGSCCASIVDFYFGHVLKYKRDYCHDVGVRAVRP